MSRDLPHLVRTRKAVAEYDELDQQPIPSSNAEALEYLKRLDDLGEAVGIAFGQDTADRNSMETCRKYVRPGKADAKELSFVRKFLADEDARFAKGMN